MKTASPDRIPPAVLDVLLTVGNECDRCVTTERAGVMTLYFPQTGQLFTLTK
jgi:hypothetical protein